MGAVGEQHIVELLHDGYSIYRKSDGVLLQRTSTFEEFWQAAGVTPTGLAYGPRVLYDATSQRWFAAAVDGCCFLVDPSRLVEPNNYLVAVSKSADPTEGWTGFKIETDPTHTTWANFPELGMNADGLYVGAEGLSATTDAVVGADFLVLPKADLLAATPSIANATNRSHLSPGQAGRFSQPVVNLDGTGLPETLLSGSYSDLGFLQSTQIGGTIGAPVLGQPRILAVPATAHAPFKAAQPGPKPDLYGGFEAVEGSAVQVGGSIWAAQTTRADGRLAVRWYELDAATNTLLQSGDLTHPTLDLYFPSIAVNPFGQVVIGMNGSSETDYAGSYAAVGETVGGVTTFGDPILLQAGRADYELFPIYSPDTNRWGDYSATVVDPSDARRFWTFQEYVEAEDIYGVRITELILPPDPQCSDGLDNDGDGVIDYPHDLGCDSPSDVSERAEPGSRLQCDDGIDNDGDGLIDYPDDPGCPFPYATIENPQCDDGIDNDGNGFTDFADSKCQASWPYWEKPSCGLGAELIVVLPLISLVARRRRRAN
jgi:hypothetical protein